MTRRFLRYPASLLASVLVATLAVSPSALAGGKDKKKDPDAIGDRDVGKGLDWYSTEKEIGLGKGMAQEVERQAKMIDDPVVTEYVNRVGQNLVRNSDCKVPVTIKVIDTDEPNAMALPGGFFYVNSGLITLAENESEIAGVMGHEIAHIAARHGTKQATRSQIAQLGTIPLMIFGGYGLASYGIYQGLNLAIPLTFLSFSRAFESEADMLGLQYMYKAGYDPNGFVDFFERLEAMEKRKPGTIGKMFRSHPPTDDRIQNAQKNIQELLKEKPEYIVTTSEFNDVKTRLASLNNRRKATPEDPNKPTLRRAPNSGPIDPNEQTKPGDENKDERPTLKRRN